MTVGLDVGEAEGNSAGIHGVLPHVHGIEFGDDAAEVVIVHGRKTIEAELGGVVGLGGAGGLEAEVPGGRRRPGEGFVGYVAEEEYVAVVFRFQGG